MTSLPKVEASAAQWPYAARLVWAILFATFWIKCAACFSVPFLSIFMFKHTALSLPAIGLVVGLQPLAALAGGFLGGHLSDRVGRKRIVLVSLLGSSLAYLGFFLVAYCLAGSEVLWLYLALLNLAAGWFGSFFWPATQALIGDLTSGQQRSQIYRYRYLAANAGSGLGPALGVSLGLAAAAPAFLATAAFYAILLLTFHLCYLGVAVADAPNPAQARSLKGSLQVLGQDRALRWLLLSAILFGMGYAQIESNLSQFIYREFSDGVRFFSYLITLNALGVILLQPLATLLESRLPANATLALGAVLFCAGCLAIAGFPSAKAAIVSAILVITAGEVLVVPTLSVLVDRIAPPGLRGIYFGAATLRQLGPAAGPALGGVVLAGYGPVALFVFMAVLGALSALLVKLSVTSVPHD